MEECRASAWQDSGGVTAEPVEESRMPELSASRITDQENHGLALYKPVENAVLNRGKHLATLSNRATQTGGNQKREFIASQRFAATACRIMTDILTVHLQFVGATCSIRTWNEWHEAFAQLTALHAVIDSSHGLDKLVATVIQKPRYLLTSTLLWGTFFFMKLFDDYDGIMSWIGAPFVATIILAISLPVVLVLGLIRRIPSFARMWYSSTVPAISILLASIVVLIFGQSLGMRESYTYTNSLEETVTATRLHSYVSLPAFFLAAFSVLYWPAEKATTLDS